MRKTVFSLAMENLAYAKEQISFQDGAFFKELTEAITVLNKFGNKLTDRGFYTSPEVNKLSEIILRNTNLAVEFLDGDPATYKPRVYNSNILDKSWLKVLSHYYKEVDLFSDIRNITFLMDKKVIDGYVDLNNSKVFGAYTKIQNFIYFPRYYFINQGFMSAEECAAIILHEVGHIFTQLEYIGRTVTTNQILSPMLRSLDKSVSIETRKVIFARGMELLKLTEEQQHAILNTDNKMMVACVVIDNAVKLSVSELGCNVYDSTSCEQLADQFAARHGGGRQIVTALDKMNKIYGSGPYERGINLVSFLKTLGLTVASLGLYLVCLFCVNVANASRYGKTYDSSKSRFIRLKLQNIEQLKDRDLPLALVTKLVKDNEIIDDIVKLYNENLTFIEKVANFIKPSYNNAYKYEMLQKELELLANNNLFTAAAKLSTI